MTTQPQGKGKKKNKEQVKVSLDEFNQIDAPHGHSVVSITKVPGLDWAATMADHELTTETQQIVVPIAPRAQRGPNVDFDQLPDSPPFKATLYNVPMACDEKDISEYFFRGLDVKSVEISKSETTVEFGSKADLYEALAKDGTGHKNKTINVCLYGHAPQNSYQDRYGDRYGDRNDRYGGQSGGFGGSRMGDRYGDRPGGGFSDRGRDGGGFDNRNREAGFAGYNRSGMGSPRDQPRSGYGNRFQERGNFGDSDRGPGYSSGGGEPDSEEPKNWRARPPTMDRVPPPPPHRHIHHAPPHPQPPEMTGDARPRVGQASRAALNQWLGTQ